MKNKTKNYEEVWTCDYCSKEFSTKKESDLHEVECKLNPSNEEIVNPKKFHVVFWLTAIISFIAQMWLVVSQVTNKNYTWSNLVTILVLVNIGMGILFFIGTIVNKDKKYYQKNIPIVYKKTCLFALIYFLIFTIPTLVDVYAYQGSPTKNKVQIPINMPTPTTVSINASPTVKIEQKTVEVEQTKNVSQVDCVGPDGKHFRATQIECDEFNSSWSNKIDCSGFIGNSSLSYNFGNISPEECANNINKIKNIQPTTRYINQIPTPIQPQYQTPTAVSNYNAQALQECLKVPNQKLADYNKKVSASGLGDYASNPYVLQIKNDIQTCYSKYGQ